MGGVDVWGGRVRGEGGEQAGPCAQSWHGPGKPCGSSLDSQSCHLVTVAPFPIPANAQPSVLPARGRACPQGRRTPVMAERDTGASSWLSRWLSSLSLSFLPCNWKMVTMVLTFTSGEG